MQAEPLIQKKKNKKKPPSTATTTITKNHRKHKTRETKYVFNSISLPLLLFSCTTNKPPSLTTPHMIYNNENKNKKTEKSLHANIFVVAVGFTFLLSFFFFCVCKCGRVCVVQSILFLGFLENLFSFSPCFLFSYLLIP